MKLWTFVVFISAVSLVVSCLAHTHRSPHKKKGSSPKLPSSSLSNGHKYNKGKYGGGIVRKRLSCRANPLVCRLRGSAGRNCCRSACVDVQMDERNCGRCGNRCGPMETCCGGGCVDLLFNGSHCGRCSNKCKKGASCSYGMCDYA